MREMEVGGLANPQRSVDVYLKYSSILLRFAAYASVCAARARLTGRDFSQRGQHARRNTTVRDANRAAAKFGGARALIFVANFRYVHGIPNFDQPLAPLDAKILRVARVFISSSTFSSSSCFSPPLPPRPVPPPLRCFFLSLAGRMERVRIINGRALF